MIQYEVYNEKDKEYKLFFPLRVNPYFEELSNKTFDEFEDLVYGKEYGGVVGHNPWYTYKTVKKEHLRVRK